MDKESGALRFSPETPADDDEDERTSSSSPSVETLGRGGGVGGGSGSFPFSGRWGRRAAPRRAARPHLKSLGAVFVQHDARRKAARWILDVTMRATGMDLLWRILTALSFDCFKDSSSSR